MKHRVYLNLLAVWLGIPTLALSQESVEQGSLRFQMLERRQIASGERHVWTVPLQPRQLAVVEILEHAVSLEARVLDPDGATTREFTVQSGYRADRLFWFAGTSGEWTVEVVPVEPDQPGAYEIEWIRRRELRDDEIGLLQAEQDARRAAALALEGKNADAETLYLSVLSRREAILGDDHPDVARTLCDLGGTVTWTNIRAGEAYYGRALAIQEAVLGLNHPEVAFTLNGLGYVQKTLRRYSNAELSYRRALEIDEEHHGPYHPRVADDLNVLGSLYHELGMYAEAEQLLRRSTDVNAKVRGKPHSSTLEALANLYKSQGRFDDAAAKYRQALTIREEFYGPEDPRTAMVWGNLAGISMDQGRYAEAERLFQHVYKVYEASQSPVGVLLLGLLNNWAILYTEQGRYEEAEDLLERAITLAEEVVGSEDGASIGLHHTLAYVHVLQERYSEAEVRLARVRAFYEETVGLEHPSVDNLLDSLGNLFARQGRVEEAIAWHQRALSVREKSLGVDHPDVGRSLYELARVRFDAERELDTGALDRAIAILDASTASPTLRIDAYGLRARVRYGDGDRVGALRNLAEALSSAEALRPQRGGGEEVRARFFAHLDGHFDRMVSWQLEAGNVEEALSYAERGRARVLLDQLAGAGVDVRESIPPEERASLEARELDAKARLAEFQERLRVTRTRTDLSEEDRSRQLDELMTKAREAERDYEQVYTDIKNASPLYQELITSRGESVELATIQRELVPSGGYMLLYQLGEEQSHLFVVPDSGAPEAIALELDGDAMVPNLANPEHDRLRTDRELHALWKRVVPEKVWARIGKSSQIVLVPDGPLHYLPFEALVIEEPQEGTETRYWLDDGPAIRYAASATTLHNLERRRTKASTVRAALSVADPIYDRSESESTSAYSRESYQRAGGLLDRLPGTAREAAVIREVVDETLWEWEELSELEATERRLRDSVSEKRYIHLATHGLVQYGERSFFSALALTPPLEVTDPEDDGFLQLHEIYELPLSGCELAVLSACETNVGRNIEGEGPFALSRAFLAAGANRVVASQWSVDDASTAELMGAFFERIMEDERAGREMNYAVALRDARRTIRHESEWASPFFWAPFILTGIQ